MIVLGIDPGITNMGLGVVEQVGKQQRLLYADVITTKHSTPAPERIGRIYQTVLEVVRTYKPQAIAVEEQFFYRQNELAYKVGWAMGALLVVAAQHDLPVYGYGPPKVKQALVGYGHADKDQVAFMVRAVLGLKETPKPSHKADAIAIALTHCFFAKLGQPSPV
ncbi:crossover junction endodeoxyribonuclease RuvC [Calidithermus roseus]|uniref:Crossover junction endodeoxyribonuclease RuvC n=1 Tax=Calidithermus roseus TaxID=1644118 RepID=A0A399EH06_9DEIN|nr:crossover junction endodeoxyribonuclease RuvC [Calidithermus roseus]RIH83944.1 Crossover junction endodeoxyribonuclease RuvC [Calidithermus roseus]